MTLRLGTRGSALAMAQSGQVADEVRRVTGQDVELVEIVTHGDRSAEPIARLGVGVFVSALRDALLAKEIDFAVHSFKDLPTAAPDRLHIAAVPRRVDPRDALVARDGLTLTELPPGARVGTAAPRRIAQLKALGLDVVPVPTRGNVDTRLRKVASGELDAVILARAGLLRLGYAAEVTEIIDPMLMLPAPAQGALAIECRAADTDLIEALGALDDPDSRLAVLAERALLATLEAGCSAPVAALAEVADADPPAGAAGPTPPASAAGPTPPASAAGDTDQPGGTAGADRPATRAVEIYLRGAAFSLDGSFTVRLSRTAETLIDPAAYAGAAGSGTIAVDLGRLLAGDLLAAGADTALGVTHDPHA